MSWQHAFLSSDMGLSRNLNVDKIIISRMLKKQPHHTLMVLIKSQNCSWLPMTTHLHAFPNWAASQWPELKTKGHTWQSWHITDGIDYNVFAAIYHTFMHWEKENCLRRRHNLINESPLSLRNPTPPGPPPEIHLRKKPLGFFFILCTGNVINKSIYASTIRK